MLLLLIPGNTITGAGGVVVSQDPATVLTRVQISASAFLTNQLSERPLCVSLATNCECECGRRDLNKRIACQEWRSERDTCPDRLAQFKFRVTLSLGVHGRSPLTLGQRIFINPNPISADFCVESRCRNRSGQLTNYIRSSRIHIHEHDQSQNKEYDH